jgi:hypothetical protein
MQHRFGPAPADPVCPLTNLPKRSMKSQALAEEQKLDDGPGQRAGGGTQVSGSAICAGSGSLSA